MDITKILNNLSEKRKVFVSEADFQFALAWEIKSERPETDVRLEYCPVNIDSSMHIDILIKIGEDIYPIELKYMTKKSNFKINEEEFILKDQSAQDAKRYDFIKDICRLEKLSGAMENFKEGYCIAVTNDPNYWKKGRKEDTCDADFRISHNDVKKGMLQWGIRTGKGTIKNREQALILKDKYDVCWKNYSEIDNSSSGGFKYLCLKVSNEVKNLGGFLICENLREEKKFIIHKDNCIYCNSAQAARKNKGEKWHGTFNTYEDARVYAYSLGKKEGEDCKSCNPRGDILNYNDIEQIKIFVGGYWQDNYNIYINFINGKLIWSDDFIQENKREFTLNKEQINFIKNELREVKVLNWNKNYVDNYILDGTQWKLNIKMNNKEKEIYGSNKYPDEWNRFYKLLFNIMEN